MELQREELHSFWDGLVYAGVYGGAKYVLGKNTIYCCIFAQYAPYKSNVGGYPRRGLVRKKALG